MKIWNLLCFSFVATFAASAAAEELVDPQFGELDTSEPMMSVAPPAEESTPSSAQSTTTVAITTTESDDVCDPAKICTEEVCATQHPDTCKKEEEPKTLLWKYVLVCENQHGEIFEPKVDDAGQKDCACDEGFVDIVRRKRHFKNYTSEVRRCVPADLNDFEARIAALEAVAHPTKAEVDDLRRRLGELEELLPELMQRLEELEVRIEGLEGRVRRLEGRVDELEDAHILRWMELGLGPTVGVTSRFRDGYTTSLDLGGKLKATGWVSDAVGVRGTGTVGYGVNPNDGLTVGMWTLGPTFALDGGARDHTLTLSVGGLREEATQATNVSGVFGALEYQAHLNAFLFLDVLGGLGSFQENPYVGGVRQDVGPRTLGAVGFLTFGGYIGADAPPPRNTAPERRTRRTRTSSSAETGGRVLTP